MNTTRADRILNLLKETFEIINHEIINESHLHHVPENSETHFKVILISNDFEGLSLIKRHRLVQKCLSQELQNGLHALSMHLYTEKEWEARGKSSSNSPSCRDGYDQ